MDPKGPESPDYLESFRAYFDRPVAQDAARPLSNGIEIELRIRESSGSEQLVLTFTKESAKNIVKQGAARDPQVVFTLTPAAADTILADSGQDIGTIGVGIAKLIVSTDPERKVAVSLRTGFMNLFSKGYFGVIAAGGAHFAAYLASKGLSGMGAIKDTIQKMRKNP